MLEIVEIIRPAEQGRNKAFICRGEDETLYFVKGKNAGRRRQSCEWVAGKLADRFGLPIPASQLVLIPSDLLIDASEEFKEIGDGVAFASHSISHAQWFEKSFVPNVPISEQSDILIFDWWVQNDDRLVDNPNLLWDSAEGKVHIIDHDSAFSPDFFPTVFRNYHIFNECFNNVFNDLVSQAEYSSRLIEALSIFDDACSELPADWLDHNSNNPNLFDPTATRMVLERCLTQEIWNLE